MAKDSEYDPNGPQMRQRRGQTYQTEYPGQSGTRTEEVRDPTTHQVYKNNNIRTFDNSKSVVDTTQEHNKSRE